MSKSLLFSTRAYSYLKDELLLFESLESGSIMSKYFPDGECYHRVESDVHKRHCVLIGGTIDDLNTMELYDIAQGLVQQGAASLTIIIPYFGYATMERAVHAGEIVKAKNRALLFSSIPPCEEANKVILLDLHSEGIPYYFDRDIRVAHVYCKPLIASIILNLAPKGCVLAATDAGRAKWVESLAMDLHIPSAFVYKQRLSGTETQITGVNADVRDKLVVIYDDMIRTGGSLMNAAKAYREAGADQIYAITTHGLFTNHALEKIAEQGIIQKVYSTNTHPLAFNENNTILEVKSVASIIFAALQ
jgi:ribose-phosphate pyrophosphokinase